MSDATITFHAIGDSIKGAEKSQMFGKPCYKVNGKAFLCFFQEEMVFKLNGDAHRNALSLDGSKMFDPSAKDRPMKEWIQVSYQYHDKWKTMAKAAFNYVAGL